MDVAARMKAARLLRGMTQEELARKLADAGLSLRTAGALERGELQMKPVHKAALVAALGTSDEWFTAPVDDVLHSRRGVADEVLGRLERIEQKLGE